MKANYYWILTLLLSLGVACQQPAIESTSQVVVRSFLPFTPASGVKAISQLAIDASDNLYFSDYNGHRIWKLTPEARLSVFAGSGTAGLRDGLSEQAQFDSPKGLAFDAEGNLYVSQNLAIRRITPQGMVSTVYGAGVGGIPTHYLTSDTTKYPYLEGSLLLVSSTALAFDKLGNLFVAQADNNARVLKITPTKRVSVFFGEPFYNQLLSGATNAVLYKPTGLVFDPQGNLIITDGLLYSSLIRVSPSGSGTYFSSHGYNTEPITGTTMAPFLPSNSVAAKVDGAIFDKEGNLYVCNDEYIEKVTPDGQVSTIAGNGKSSINTEPADNGLGNQVRLFSTHSPVLDSKGNLYFIEQSGIRKLVFSQ